MKTTKKLEPQSRGNIAMDPQSCNISLTCEICGRTIPAHEEYWDAQVHNGSGQVCLDHGLDEVCEWAGEE